MKFWKIIAFMLALAALIGACAYFIPRLIPDFSCPLRKAKKSEEPEPFVQEHV